MNRLRAATRWCAARPQWPLGVLVLLPLLVTLCSALLNRWYPTGDYAHTELNVRALWSHPPQIGVAGRFGPFDNQHSHPGPSMAYLLWPLYALFGSSAASLLVSTVALHAAALVGSVFVAARVGGRSLAVAAAIGALLLERALGGQFFVTPWNPWMPVTAFWLFLFCVLAVSVGHWRLAPLAVLAGTHAAQTHVSYMVLVHGLMGFALLAAVWWVRRHPVDGRRAWRAPLRWAAVSASLGLLMWLPPLRDQFRGSRNLSWLFHHFADPCDVRYGGSCEPSVGLRAALKAMAAELNPFGAWLSGAFHDPVSYAPNLLGVLLTAVVLVVVARGVWRRRDDVLTVAFAQVVLLGVLAVGSVSRIIGDFYDYVIRWSWPTAAFCAALLAWMLFRIAPAGAWRPEGPGAARRLLAAGAAVAALCSGAAGVRALGTEPPYLQESKLVGGLVDGLVDGASPLDRSPQYLLRWHDPAGLGGVGFGLVLELERRGYRVGTDSWTRYAVLPFRVVPEAQADRLLWVIVGTKNIDAFAARADATLVARFDPRTPDQVRRSDEARAHIEQRLAELGRDDLLARIDGQFGNASLIAAGRELPADVNEAVSVYTELRLPAAMFTTPTGVPGFTGAGT